MYAYKNILRLTFGQIFLFFQSKFTIIQKCRPQAAIMLATLLFLLTLLLLMSFKKAGTQES
jgi:hypothetical protein